MNSYSRESAGDRVRDRLGFLPRALILILFVVVLIAVVLVVRALWIYLADEHRRLGPLASVLTWTGDLASLVFFVRFCVVHGFLGLRPEPSRGRLWTRLSVIFFGSLALDCLLSAAFAYEDYRGYQRAAPAKGLVSRMDRKDWDTGRYGAMWCCRVQYEFTVNGTTYTGVARVHNRRDWGEFGKPAEKLRDMVQRQSPPFELAVRYDPKWPQRSWPAEMDWSGESYNLHWISLQLAFWQAVVLLIALWGLAKLDELLGRFSLWSDLFQIVPLLLGLACYAILSTTLPNP